MHIVYRFDVNEGFCLTLYFKCKHVSIVAYITAVLPLHNMLDCENVREEAEIIAFSSKTNGAMSDGTTFQRNAVYRWLQVTLQ